MTELPRITPDSDGGVTLHIPDFTHLDTQVWAVDIGLTLEALEALRDLLERDPPIEGSCPGVEMDPNPCTCTCEGCKYHCGAHQGNGRTEPDPCSGCRYVPCGACAQRKGNSQ